MSGRLRIVAAGVCCTIQDGGRRGYLRHGVSTSGPMDWVSLQLAQQLAGAASSQPVIEVSIGGLELEVASGIVRLGLAGGGFTASVDGVAIRHPACVRLAAGMRLTIKTGASGSWFYVAPSGAMDLAPVMGSNATHARYSIGPAGGKLLAQGAEIGIVGGGAGGGDHSTVFPHLTDATPIRIMLGPQDDLFSQPDIALFLASTYQLSLRNDRMAYVLEGPRIHPAASYDIVTDATALGSIQMAGDGSPYVLMADRSSTGGYPKIATIIRADIGRFAQKRSGEPIRFVVTSRGQAVSLLREVRAALELVGSRRHSGQIDIEALSRGDDPTGVCHALQFDF